MSSKQNNTIIACISYWIRERYYGTALAQVDKSLAGFPSEMNSTRMGVTTELSGTGDAKLTLLLLKAYCLCKLGRTADSTRLLQPLIGQFPSSKIAILHTLRIVHLSESTVDKETLREIERQIQTEWMESSDESAYLAALILLLENLVDRARLFLDKLNSTGNSRVIFFVFFSKFYSFFADLFCSISCQQLISKISFLVPRIAWLGRHYSVHRTQSHQPCHNCDRLHQCNCTVRSSNRVGQFGGCLFGKSESI